MPRKLTIMMWDFSWYTITLSGEPYNDFESRFKEAVDRVHPVGMKLIYLHDWADPDQWVLYLYDRYGAHKLAMLQKADMRLEEAHE